MFNAFFESDWCFLSQIGFFGSHHNQRRNPLGEKKHILILVRTTGHHATAKSTKKPSREKKAYAYKFVLRISYVFY